MTTGNKRVDDSDSEILRTLWGVQFVYHCYCSIKICRNVPIPIEELPLNVSRQPMRVHISESLTKVCWVTSNGIPPETSLTIKNLSKFFLGSQIQHILG